MGTSIGTKKKFLEWLDRIIDDGKMIILTDEMSGNLRVSKKRNSKTVQFEFAADAFADNDSIGHFLLGKTPAISFCICNEEDVDPAAITKIKELPAAGEGK